MYRDGPQWGVITGANEPATCAEMREAHPDWSMTPVIEPDEPSEAGDGAAA